MDLDFAMWNTLSSGTSSRRSLNPVIVETIPVNLTPPVISGIPEVGETLFGTTGNWSGGSLSYSYQWNLDGSGPISGATSINYVTESAGTYYLTVTASNSAGSTPADSNQIEISEPDPFLSDPLLFYSGSHLGDVFLDADSNPASPGEAVAVIVDQSDEGANATQPTGSLRGLLRSAETPSGLPAVELDGIDDFYISNISLSGECTAFSVMQRTGGGGGGRYLSLRRADAQDHNDQGCIEVEYNSGNIRVYYWGGGGFLTLVTSSGIAVDNQWVIVALRYVPAVGVTLWVNGQLFAQTNPNTGLHPLNVTELRIGGNEPADGGSMFGGNFACQALVSSALTDEQINERISYLATQYGITL